MLMDSLRKAFGSAGQISECEADWCEGGATDEEVDSDDEIFASRLGIRRTDSGLGSGSKLGLGSDAPG